MKDYSIIKLFIDNELQPIAVFPAPVTFELDSTKLTDGNHVLKIISNDNKGREGVRLLPFVVRNGPAIAIDGLKQDEVVEGVLPLMINAYGKGDQKIFLLHGSETPMGLPWWLVAGIVIFLAWSFYFIFNSLAFKIQ